jgi:hypothetical protein
MSTIELNVGPSRWSLSVPDDRLARAVRAPPSRRSTTLPPRSAMRSIIRVDSSTAARALTPDDRIALVIDERLP